MAESNRDTAATEQAAPTRRAVLLGVGAVGAAGLLAACGGTTPASPPAAGGATTTGGVNTTSASPPAAPAESGGANADIDPNAIKVADIPVGGGTVFADKKVVVTQPTAGTFKAFSATCTHQGCTVGDVTGGKINCPCHGSQYNIADGSVARGPSTQRLPAKTATVNGATITVT